MWALIGLYVSLLVACFACGGRQPGLPSKATERTVWQVCIDSEWGVEVPPDKPPHTPPCKKPTIWKWDRLPVRVALDPDNLVVGAEFGPKEALSTAVRTWNEWLGFKVFEVVTDGDIDVLVRAGEISAYAGLALLGAPDGHKLGMVFVFAGYETDVGVYAHELGHILGLAHDRDVRWSVMWPSAGEQIPRLTELDRKTLRYIYGFK